MDYTLLMISSMMEVAATLGINKITLLIWFHCTFTVRIISLSHWYQLVSADLSWRQLTSSDISWRQIFSQIIFFLQNFLLFFFQKQFF
jgi:hypothetical protein